MFATDKEPEGVALPRRQVAKSGGSPRPNRRPGGARGTAGRRQLPRSQLRREGRSGLPRAASRRAAPHGAGDGRELACNALGWQASAAVGGPPARRRNRLVSGLALHRRAVYHRSALSGGVTESRQLSEGADPSLRPWVASMEAWM